MSQDKDKTVSPEAPPVTDAGAGEMSRGEAPLEVETTSAASAMATANERREKGGRGFPLVATLALLLVLALAGGSAWVLLEAQRREAALLERMSRLESVTERELMDAGEQQAQLRRFSDTLQGELQQTVRDGLSENASRLSTQSARLGELAVQLDAVEERVSNQGKALARVRATDRESWQLAEVEYLLRLANQRLIMTGDLRSAQALLTSADGVLAQVEDPRLHPVRAAVAADLAALRAVPALDTEGLYLRLSALAEQLERLSIFELPEPEQRPAPPPADTWRGRLQQGYEAALQKLSGYLIIRRRDVPVETLIDPQLEGLLRQNLRMLLEQAQVALLSGNQRLYRESLQRARAWLSEFFVADERRAQTLSQELDQLAGEDVERELPDIAGSLQALELALAARERSILPEGD